MPLPFDILSNLNNTRRLNRRNKQIERTELTGVLGDENNNIYVPGKNGNEVYVRLLGDTENGNATYQPSTTAYIRGDYFEYPGSGVVLKYNNDGDLVVIGADEKQVSAAGSTLSMATLNSGSKQSKFISLDSVLRLISRPVSRGTTDSLLVSVAQFIYDHYGNYIEFNGTPLQADKIDLSSYMPSAGNHRLVQLWLDTYNNTVQITASTAQALTTAIDSTDYNECWSGATRYQDWLPLQSYVLKDNASTITQKDLGRDHRQFVNLPDTLGNENELTINTRIRANRQFTVHNELVIPTGYNLDIITGGELLIPQSVGASGALINPVDVIEFNISYTETGSEPAGSVYYTDAEEDVLNFVSQSGPIAQLPEELWIPVANRTGASLVDGTVCRFDGTIGASGKIKVAKMIADGTYPPQYLVGLITHTVANDADGKCTWYGKVRGIDTTGTPVGETWVDGDILYVSPTTAGALTNVRPDAPYRKIFVAVVVNAHANGTLFVRPDFINRLSGLDDVNLDPLDSVEASNNEALFWDSTNEYWDAKRLGELPIFDIALRQPTGFEKLANGAPPTDSLVTYNPATRTVSVAPTGTSFNYWLKGVEYTISSTQQLTHADTTAIWFFYWNSSNTLTLSTTPWSIMEDVPIAAMYYNSTLADGFCLEERHGATRSPHWHYSEHFTRGTYWNDDGLALSGYTEQPASPIDSDNQWAVSSGTIHDEDIANALNGISAGSYEVFYRSGASGEWTWSNNNVPLLAGTYIQYNEWTGATWQLTDAANNNYVNYFIFAVPVINADTKYNIVVIPGQDVFSTLVSARGESVSDLDFGTLPFTEFVSIYKITFRTSASWSTEGKCRIEEVADTRRTTREQVITSAPGGSHSALSSLTWDVSGHIGTASTYAGFDSSGNATFLTGGSGDLEFIEEKTILSNTTSTTFTGLSGDYIYILQMRISNPLASTVNYQITINGDTSLADYYTTQFFTAGSSNGSNALVNESRSGLATANDFSFIVSEICTHDDRFFGMSRCTAYTGSDSITGTITYMDKNTASASYTSISSISIIAGTSNGIGTDTTIRLYRTLT
jgi:hypothetical protein